MFGIGHMELLIVLGICVLLFGARKIPELGRGLGQGIRSFRDGIKGLEEETSGIQKAVSAKGGDVADDGSSASKA